MSKCISLLYLFLTLIVVGPTWGQSAASEKSSAGVYNPKYWLEGIGGRQEMHPQAETDYEKYVSSAVNDAYRQGWNGVLFWGADRRGPDINYYFDSPYLKTKSWAEFKGDKLSPLVKAARRKNMEVMINIEGINPYHWKENKWTPDVIGAVAKDLAGTGVNAVFEECFEVRPEVFLSLANTLKDKRVNYISGTDPMLLREASFASLWPSTAVVNIYNYYVKRDKIFNIATLTQHGSLGYGWAKYWGKPTSLISPLNRNWGMAEEYSPAVVSYICMIRALQFRLDNFIIFGGKDKFDPAANRAWINEYVNKQEKDRHLMNIVVLLKKQAGYQGGETGEVGWNRLFNSGDAITSGAMNAGYDIVVSDKVLPADAYWIYANGGDNDVLPAEVVELFNTDKPVFLQASTDIPSGNSVPSGWKTVLAKCGVDASRPFKYGRGPERASLVSLPEDQTEEIPYTGYYKDRYLRFTGSDVQRGMDLRAGTVIPKEAIRGTVYCAPNRTYGKGPYITGQNKKYLVTAAALNWEVAYPISDLLSGAGIAPSSNVWGIAGKSVTALLAIETTELEVRLPGVSDGERLHVVVWDNKQDKKSEETIVYRAPYKRLLNEYDFLLIDKVD
ncbi:MAG TPA: hypothetical protein VF490_03255 [Chryseosolibacter sp.]